MIKGIFKNHLRFLPCVLETNLHEGVTSEVVDKKINGMYWNKQLHNTA